MKWLLIVYHLGQFQYFYHISQENCDRAESTHTSLVALADQLEGKTKKTTIVTDCIYIGN